MPEVSYDGATYERAGDLEKGSITLKPGRAVKAVRIVSTCDDNGHALCDDPAAADQAGAVTAACSGQQRRIGAAGLRHMVEKVASRMPSGHRRTDGTAEAIFTRIGPQTGGREAILRQSRRTGTAPGSREPSRRRCARERPR